MPAGLPRWSGARPPIWERSTASGHMIIAVSPATNRRARAGRSAVPREHRGRLRRPSRRPSRRRANQADGLAARTGSSRRSRSTRAGLPPPHRGRPLGARRCQLRRATCGLPCLRSTSPTPRATRTSGAVARTGRTPARRRGWRRRRRPCRRGRPVDPLDADSEIAAEGGYQGGDQERLEEDQERCGRQRARQPAAQATSVDGPVGTGAAQPSPLQVSPLVLRRCAGRAVGAFTRVVAGCTCRSMSDGEDALEVVGEDGQGEEPHADGDQ